MMLTFDEFDKMIQEEIALLPDYVLEDLPGGVLIDQQVYLHPARVQDDLYILGTYSQGGYMGKQIVLYYGSFMATLGNAPEEMIREKIRETVRHEFLHHMEARAGEKSLAREDIERLKQYYSEHGHPLSGT